MFPETPYRPVPASLLGSYPEPLCFHCHEGGELANIVFHISWEKLVGRGGKGGLLVLAFRESIEKSLKLVLYHLGHPFLYDSRTGSQVLLHALVTEC